jgi:hypothetical protein
MATLAGSISYTGSIGELSAYRMRGSEKIILRTKSGPGRKQIKLNPNYEMTRLNNEEWKGCIMAGKNIRAAMYAVKHLADYNFSGKLNSLCKNIQLDDTMNKKGTRSVLLSQTRYKLEGFSLNLKNTTESIMRHPLDCTIDRDAGKATIDIPIMVPGINFYNPFIQPLYRFIIVLGAVSDIVYDPGKKIYAPVTKELPSPAVEYTDWRSCKENSPAQHLSLSLSNWQNEPDASLLLSLGIEFGTPVSQAEVKHVKYAGAARLMKMV